MAQASVRAHPHEHKKAGPVTISRSRVIHNFLACAFANLAITHYEFSDPTVIPAQLELSEGVLIAGSLVSPEGSTGYTLIEVRDQEDTLYGATLTDQDGYFEMRVTNQ